MTPPHNPGHFGKRDSPDSLTRSACPLVQLTGPDRTLCQKICSAHLGKRQMVILERHFLQGEGQVPTIPKSSINGIWIWICIEVWEEGKEEEGGRASGERREEEQTDTWSWEGEAVLRPPVVPSRPHPTPAPLVFIIRSVKGSGLCTPAQDSVNGGH